jgi:TolA-binding protein
VEHGGARAALAYLDALTGEVGRSELAETIAYERAVHLALAGDEEGALAAFLATAERFPYPLGAYWDDALYRAAELEVALGRPRRASRTSNGCSTNASRSPSRVASSVPASARPASSSR